MIANKYISTVTCTCLSFNQKRAYHSYEFSIVNNIYLHRSYPPSGFVTRAPILTHARANKRQSRRDRYFFRRMSPRRDDNDNNDDDARGFN